VSRRPATGRRLFGRPRTAPPAAGPTAAPQTLELT
jgi:hypothetical protein